MIADLLGLNSPEDDAEAGFGVGVYAGFGAGLGAGAGAALAAGLGAGV